MASIANRESRPSVASHICNHCDKHFTRAEHLRRHLLSRENVSAFLRSPADLVQTKMKNLMAARHAAPVLGAPMYYVVTRGSVHHIHQECD